MKVQRLNSRRGSDHDVAVGPARIGSRSSRRTPCAPFFRTGCGRSAVEEIQQRRQIYLEGAGLSRTSRTGWISLWAAKKTIVSSVSGLGMKSTASPSGFWSLDGGDMAPAE
jgi:hypothetical protein